MSDFARSVVRWQQRAGRNDLPWQGTRDPYAIWVSEIMLQQTQVATVVPFYARFMARFPDIATLAAAPLDDVMRLWSGLGYYSRARNLHRAAQLVVSEHGSVFPGTLAEIERLPGVGRSTAAAIAGFAFGARAAILDGNVKRLLARHFLVEGFPGDRAVEGELWSLAESLLPKRDVAPYIQGLMDLGALICTTRRPGCPRCPLRATCGALIADRVDELPASRPRRKVPTRTTVMAVLRHGGDVLLEKRPASGVWGGLWSLPEMATDADLRGIVARRFGCEVRRIDRLTPIRHTFTHFTLEIAPMLIDVDAPTPGAAEPGSMWLPLASAVTAALPAPVKRLLVRLSDSSLGHQASLLEEALQDL
jgi:A/G-specific adenine glycosylase